MLDPYNLPPLIHAIIHDETCAIIPNLLLQGAELNKCYVVGIFTGCPLMFAVSREKQKAVELILEYIKKIKLTDIDQKAIAAAEKFLRDNKKSKSSNCLVS